jgi:hypothetical protein
LAYTREMAIAVRKIGHPYPGAFNVDMVEYPGNHIGVRVYENQLMELDESRRVTSMEFLNQIRLIIESFGATCFVEGVPGDPPKKK